MLISGGSPLLAIDSDFGQISVEAPSCEHLRMRDFGQQMLLVSAAVKMELALNCGVDKDATAAIGTIAKHRWGHWIRSA
jgi:hypothetical protein